VPPSHTQNSFPSGSAITCQCEPCSAWASLVTRRAPRCSSRAASASMSDVSMSRASGSSPPSLLAPAAAAALGHRARAAAGGRTGPPRRSGHSRGPAPRSRPMPPDRCSRAPSRRRHRESMPVQLTVPLGRSQCAPPPAQIVVASGRVTAWRLPARWPRWPPPSARPRRCGAGRACHARPEPPGPTSQRRPRRAGRGPSSRCAGTRPCPAGVPGERGQFPAARRGVLLGHVDLILRATGRKPHRLHCRAALAIVVPRDRYLRCPPGLHHQRPLPAPVLIKPAARSPPAPPVPAARPRSTCAARQYAGDRCPAG